MDLATTQQLLAALYTDTALRERYSVEPLVVAQQFGITGEEARRLEGLSAAQVAGFARTLERKRLSEMRRALPRTCRALGSGLAQALGLHGARFHSQGVNRGLVDAIAFAKYLSSEPGKIADLARYEANWLRFRYGRAWPLLAFFQSDPRETGASRNAETGAPQWTVAVWFRFGGRIQHVVMRLPKFWQGGLQSTRAIRISRC